MSDDLQRFRSLVESGAPSVHEFPGALWGPSPYDRERKLAFDEYQQNLEDVGRRVVAAVEIAGFDSSPICRLLEAKTINEETKLAAFALMRRVEAVLGSQNKTTSQPEQQAVNKKNADREEVLAKILGMIKKGNRYPGSYEKLRRLVGGSNGLMTKLFQGHEDLQNWKDEKSVSCRTYEKTDMKIEEAILPDDEISTVIAEMERALPEEDREELRDKLADMSTDEKRRLCITWQNQHPD